MKDQERDQIRKLILKSLARGRMCWTDLKKKVLGSCQPFATDRTFANQMRYLEETCCIRKLNGKRSRAPYEITDKGKLQLKVLR